MPVRLNIPTEVIWDPILDNYLGPHQTINSGTNHSSLCTVPVPSAINAYLWSEQAANVVTCRLLPVTGIAKQQGVYRPQLNVRPTSLQRGHQSNNGVSVNCGGEWCHINIWRLLCCPAVHMKSDRVISHTDRLLMRLLIISISISSAGSPVRPSHRYTQTTECTTSVATGRI